MDGQILTPEQVEVISKGGSGVAVLLAVAFIRTYDQLGRCRERIAALEAVVFKKKGTKDDAEQS